MNLPLTPSQTVGPFWHFGLELSDATTITANSGAITVAGLILDGDGAPVTDAMIEVWQADAAGSYAAHDGFRGFGRIRADREGGFRLVTVMPGAVAGSGNAPQAPHLNVAIFARGLQKALYTRMYFPDEPLNQTDPVLGCVADEARRATLIAHRDAPALYRWRIVLQGDKETVFFEF